MLLELKIKNFRSVKDQITLSMQKLYDNGAKNLLDISGVKLLKSMLISGPNASGKSNIIQAIEYINYLVRSSSKYSSTRKIEYEPFKLDNNTKTEPSEFELTILVDGQIYIYGFAVNDIEIVAEYLYRQSNRRKIMIFTRKGNQPNNGKHLFEFKLQEKEQRTLSERTGNNKLYLSVSADWNFQITKQLYDYIQNKLFILSSDNSIFDSINIYKEIYDNKKFKEQVLSKLKQVDFGIKGIEIDAKDRKSQPSQEFMNDFLKFIEMKDGTEKAEKLKEEMFSPKSYKPFLLHEYNQNNKLVTARFTLDEESLGTTEFIQKLGLIIYVIDKGGILFIDELEDSLHPYLTQFLNAYINSEENQKAQVIYTTHCYDLLDLNVSNLRHDQINFTQKREDQSTELFSLGEFNERKDVSIMKRYFEGRYGALPFVQKEVYE